jgi:hypothetical protein
MTHALAVHAKHVRCGHCRSNPRYLFLPRSHKWWYCLFFFLLDTIVGNMWIIHSDLSFCFLQDPISHMDFQLQLAKEMASKWAGRKHGYPKFAPFVPAAHGPQSMGKERGFCIVCGQRTNQACPGCHRHICKGACYWSIH